MSDFTIRSKSPTPVEYTNQQLRIAQSSPARQRVSGNASQKLEMRGQSVQHTMGKKSGQTFAVAPPTSTQTAKAKPTPGKAPGSVSSAKVEQAAPAVETAPTPVAPIFSPGSAMLIGQLLEGFIFNELLGPRANSPMTYIAKEALVAIQPLLPTGVSIPVPVITPEMAAQYGIGPATAPSDAAAGAAPTVTIAPLAEPATVTHHVHAGTDGFTCSCGQAFGFPMGATAEQIDAAARAASVHAAPTTPAA